MSVQRAPIRRSIDVRARVVPPAVVRETEKKRRRRPVERHREDLIFLAFDYGVSPEAALIYHVRPGGAVLVATHTDLQEPGFGAIIEKAGGVHFATFELDALGVMNLYRSADRGLSWAKVLDDVGNFGGPCLEEAADGTLYISGWFSGASTAQLYRSTDKGLTWSLVSTFGADFNEADIITIACHPTDPDIIVCWGEKDDPAPGSLSFSMVGVSTNGGTSFTPITLSDDDITISNYRNIAFLPSGRCVAVYEFDTDAQFETVAYYSDDLTNWTRSSVWLRDYGLGDLVCDPGFGRLQAIGGSELLFGGNVCMSADQIKIFRSSDEGESWSFLVDGITGQDEGGRFLYLPRRRHLYVYNTFWEGPTGSILLLNRQPLDGGDWETVLESPGLVFPAFWNALAEL